MQPLANWSESVATSSPMLWDPNLPRAAETVSTSPIKNPVADQSPLKSWRGAFHQGTPPSLFGETTGKSAAKGFGLRSHLPPAIVTVDRSFI